MKVYGNRILCCGIILVLICTLMLLAVIIDSLSLNIVDEIKVLSIFALIVYLVLFLLNLIGYRSINFYIVFLGMTYLFYFGHHFLTLFNYDIESLMLFDPRITDRARVEATVFTLLGILTFSLGYFSVTPVYGRRELNFIRNDTIDSYIDRKSLRDVCIFMLIVCVLPTFMTIFENIYLTWTVGYGERMMNVQYRRSGILNILGILSEFMSAIIIGLFLTKSKDDHFILPFIVLYLILYTLQGSRINTFTLIIVLVLIYLLCYKRIDSSLLMKLVIIAFICVVVFSFISTSRVSEKDDDYLKNIASSYKKTGVVGKVIKEAGYTFAPIAAVVDHCPDDVNFIYGKSYLSGFVYLLPNGCTGNYYGSVKGTDDAFKNFINDYGSGVGSSFIAEGFYNFGYFALILFLVYGLVFGFMECNVRKGIDTRNYSKLFLIFYAFSVIVFFIRSDTRTFLRNYVWFGLPIYLMAKLLYVIRLKHVHRNFN